VLAASCRVSLWLQLSKWVELYEIGSTWYVLHCKSMIHGPNYCTLGRFCFVLLCFVGLCEVNDVGSLSRDLFFHFFINVAAGQDICSEPQLMT